VTLQLQSVRRLLAQQTIGPCHIIFQVFTAVNVKTAQHLATCKTVMRDMGKVNNKYTLQSFNIHYEKAIIWHFKNEYMKILQVIFCIRNFILPDDNFS